MDLRVLFIEDDADDVALCLRRLEEAGIRVRFERVETEGALRAALAGDVWDVALVDYSVPGFGGPSALEVLGEMAPDTPAVTVSGTIDEDTAVATIKAGAVDYVLKDNLTRLGPAVRAAVEGAGLRRDQRRATEQARQTAYALEHASQAIVYVGEDGVITYLNQAARKLTVDGSDSLVGRHIRDWSPTLDERRWRELGDVLEREKVVDIEAVVQSADGERRFVSARLDRRDAGPGPSVIIFARDVTEQRESETRLKVTLESTGIATWEWDVVNDVWSASARYFTMLGYEPESGAADRSVWLSRVHPDDREAVAARITSVLEGGEAHYDYEARMLHADGSYRWHRVLGHTVEVDEHGGTVRLVGVRMDVTERRQAEEALRRSEAQLRTLIDTLPDLVWLKDPDGVYRACNRRFEEFLGATEDDIVGRTDYDFLSPELADFFREHDKDAMAAGGPTANEEEIVFASDGHREILETIKTPIFAGDGRLMGVLGVGRDITERKLGEEEARRQAVKLRRTVEGAVLAMSHVVEARDPYTAGHERRVAQLATAIATEMGLADERVEALRLGALIHDIGKIAVPAEILAKPGRLSDVEFSLIRQHPAAGFDILAAIDFGGPVAEMALQHHERLDGSGYPAGLVGEQLILEARILAVADVVEAMSSHRPYRPTLGLEAALDEVRDHAGAKYDAAVVAACARLFAESGFAFTP